jgi:hypothetical protein
VHNFLKFQSTKVQKAMAMTISKNKGNDNGKKQ